MIKPKPLPAIPEAMEAALHAAETASDAWLAAALASGPQYTVTSGGKSVGTMLDLCGNSYLEFRDKRSAWAKMFLREGYCSLTVGSVHFEYSNKYRQESGLHKAAYRAALEVLTQAGVEGLTLRSYID